MIKLLKRLEGVKTVPSSNVRRVAAKLSRLISVGIVTCGIGTLAIFEGYNNYWDQIIFRVQTVDFNILSHTLPTKLSYTIVENKPEELQRTLDSNYSLFGLIVTDPSGQKVIAFSGKKSSHHSWSKALNPKILQSYPYDLLLDPPPLFTQWNYSDPRATERTATNFTSKGRVIGRVYYVRGIRPNFQDDLWKWLSNPISESSRAKTYTVTILACFAGGIAFWSIWEYLLYKKRVQKLVAERIETTLKQQKDTLLLQLRQRMNQINVLQTQWEQERTSSTIQSKKLRNYNQQLQQEISQLRTMISVPAVTSLQTTQAELEKAKIEAKSAQQKQLQQQDQIQVLNQQLQVFQNKLVEARQQGVSFKLLQNQIEEIRTARSSAESELQNLRNGESKSRATIALLENQLVSQHKVQDQLNRQLKILQHTLAESQQREQESHEKAERTNQQLEILTEEKKLLEEEMGRHPLNDFERAVLTCLQNSIPQKEILTQFDAGTGDDNSKFIDFVIVLEHCILALEAKSYKGLIESVGEPRNTNWTCQTESGKIRINASWGLNPYQQVKTYVDSLMFRTNYYSRIQRHKIPVYGIVVFPSEAQITFDIESNIGGFYRIITIDKLLGTITEISNKAQLKNPRSMNCNQIVNMMTSSSNSKAA